MRSKNKGFGMIEIVIALTIISSSLFALVFVSSALLTSIDKSTKNIKASFLLEEGIEAVKILRDTGWTDNIQTLTSGADYYLNFNGVTWQSVSNNVYIDNVFERKFVVEDVYRNADDDIATTTAILDPNTKKVTVDVSWPASIGTTTKSISTYITNIFNN